MLHPIRMSRPVTARVKRTPRNDMDWDTTPRWLTSRERLIGTKQICQADQACVSLGRVWIRANSGPIRGCQNSVYASRGPFELSTKFRTTTYDCRGLRTKQGVRSPCRRQDRPRQQAKVPIFGHHVAYRWLNVRRKETTACTFALCCRVKGVRNRLLPPSPEPGSR